MKIIEANAGALTNFEVLDFLISRGASKDPTRVIAPVAPSEYKVYDYLAESPASNQTREKINEFLEKSKRFNLAKAEVLNIININPSVPVEIDPIIEKSEDRFGEAQLAELINMVVEVLPPPTEPEPQEGIDEDKKKITEEEQIDEDGKKEAFDKEQTDENAEENADEGETVEDKEESADGEPIDEDDKETADGEPINGDKEETADGEQMEAS